MCSTAGCRHRRGRAHARHGRPSSRVAGAARCPARPPGDPHGRRAAWFPQNNATEAAAGLGSGGARAARPAGRRQGPRPAATGAGDPQCGPPRMREPRHWANRERPALLRRRRLRRWADRTRSGLAALFAGCLLVEVPVPATALRGVVVAIAPAAWRQPGHRKCQECTTRQFLPRWKYGLGGQNGAVATFLAPTCLNHPDGAAGAICSSTASSALWNHALYGQDLEFDILEMSVKCCFPRRGAPARTLADLTETLGSPITIPDIIP